MTIKAVEIVVKETGIKAKVIDKIRSYPHTCRYYYCHFLLRQGVDSYMVLVIRTTIKIYLVGEL